MPSVLITGAAGNLGQVLTTTFLEKGWQVLAVIGTSDVLPISHTALEVVKADLLEEGTGERILQNRLFASGGPDAAVLTVGGFAIGDLRGTDRAALRAQLRLNVETAYEVAQPVWMGMMQRGRGRIFLIGSRPGSDMRQSTGTVAYGMAKSLVFRLAELMNESALGTDVVTTVVVPSVIDTPQNRRSMPDADPGNWVTPKSIADTIFYYCTEESAAMREPVLKIYGRS
jgi:NAD(P)-dependent dehydrogenase (short-subunit alcohol dehydrogenase family)